MLFQGVHGPSTVRSQEPSRKPAIPSSTLAHSPAHPPLRAEDGAACAGPLLAPPTANVTAAVTPLKRLGARFKTSSRQGERDGASLPR